MPDVTIVEVSPRDGLQNESTILTTNAKVELISQLIGAGAQRIEAVSFAHPRLVPAMADAEDVMARVPRPDGVSYAGLILNRRGLDRAADTGVHEVNVVVCVSDTFSRRNQNVSTDEAMQMAEEVIGTARSRGLFTTLTLATAFGCPFEGEVSADRVVALARRAAASGVDELCLARRTLCRILSAACRLSRLSREEIMLPCGYPALPRCARCRRWSLFDRETCAAIEGGSCFGEAVDSNIVDIIASPC